MKSYGLIGYPLEHSFSKSYFENKFLTEHINGITYSNIETQSLNGFFNSNVSTTLDGFNVTTPYKEDIIAYLDVLNDSADTIGAVNCVKRKQGKLIGYNTDYIGFYNSIKPLLNTNHKKALILGSGGASKAIVYALNRLGINSQIVSRNSSFDYNDIDKKCMNEYHIIVNCTPLGTYPNTHTFPKIPYDNLTTKHLLYDLVYNPHMSQFLQYGKRYNCILKNGLEMLEIQAEESWHIWNGKNYTN